MHDNEQDTELSDDRQRVAGLERETAPRDPLADALAEIRGEQPRISNEGADRYWLRAGLSLGLLQPERALRLLERLERATGVVASRPAEREDATNEPPTEDTGAVDEGGAAGEPDQTDLEIPLRSMLLARSASLPAMDKAAFDPEAVFGWAARVTRGEVLEMGGVLERMLADGLPADFTKGFAITWRSGLKLPESDFDGLFHAFTELEVTVCGVLAGYDLRRSPPPARPGLLDSMLGVLLPRRDTRGAEAGDILARTGDSGRRGLVAMWNAWAALHFRAHLPRSLFEQLVQPWTTVVGPLPDG